MYYGGSKSTNNYITTTNFNGCIRLIKFNLILFENFNLHILEENAHFLNYFGEIPKICSFVEEEILKNECENSDAKLACSRNICVEDWIHGFKCFCAESGNDREEYEAATCDLSRNI